jgi:plastocyanin
MRNVVLSLIVLLAGVPGVSGVSGDAVLASGAHASHANAGHAAAGHANANASAVTGTVRVQSAAGAQPSTAVVYAEPLDGAAPRKPGTFSLAQKGKAFVPRVLAVPVGSTVTFPNQDLIYHNVFSLSAPTPFDLGLYRDGASKSQTFTQPATYRVFCNIHPQMTALIAVVPTSYVTLADANGAFSLDLPPGRYKLTAISERAAMTSQEIKVGATGLAAPAMTLDETQIQTTHKNKFGQDYPKEAWTKH